MLLQKFSEKKLCAIVKVFQKLYAIAKVFPITFWYCKSFPNFITVSLFRVYYAQLPVRRFASIIRIGQLQPIFRRAKITCHFYDRN